MSTDGRPPSAPLRPDTDTDPGPDSRPDTDTGGDSRPDADPGPLGDGRHARREGGPGRARLDYLPRHAVHTSGPGAEASRVSPGDLTEVFPRIRIDPLESPRVARPASEPVRPAPAERPPAEPAPAEPGSPGKRERVVLAERKGQARAVRTVVDVRELTEVGEVITSSLIRSQLGLALRIGGIALIGLGALPAMFAIFPVLGRIELFGVRLPWLLLGVLAYPFLFALGWMYSRSAEKLEQVFAEHIRD